MCADSCVETPIAVKRRAPSLTARTQALRSAQIVRPIEPFSTFTPSNVRPSSATSTAPTGNCEYGA